MDNQFFSQRARLPARQQTSSWLGTNMFYTYQPGVPKGAGTSIEANVSATSYNNYVFPWTIDQSVTPASLKIIPGKTGYATYTITVAKGAGRQIMFFEGQVWVVNKGAVETENLAITVNLTMPPFSRIIASLPVNTGVHPVLVPGEEFCYNYRLAVPVGSVTSKKACKMTANVSITNYLGYCGIPLGSNPSSATVLPASPTLVNDSIHVDDSYGGSFTFNDSGSKKYDIAYTCADKGVNVNITTIRETGQYSVAGIDVSCECPIMVNETVCVQADITLSPGVKIGAIKAFCVGNPVIEACAGITTEECAFSVCQQICVQIPLALFVKATVIPAGIVCGVPMAGGLSAGADCS